MSRHGRREGVVDWNSKNVALLRSLFESGHTATQIAQKIKGATRNAIIGKQERMGLKGTKEARDTLNRERAKLEQRTKVVKTPPQPKPKAPEPTTAVVKPRPFVPLPGSLCCSLLSLSHGQCRWPLEVDGTTVFCGLRQAGDGPYCRDHDSMAHNRLSESVRRDRRRLQNAQWVGRHG